EAEDAGSQRAVLNPKHGGLGFPALGIRKLVPLGVVFVAGCCFVLLELLGVPEHLPMLLELPGLFAFALAGLLDLQHRRFGDGLAVEREDDLLVVEAAGTVAERPELKVARRRLDPEMAAGEARHLDRSTRAGLAGRLLL